MTEIKEQQPELVNRLNGAIDHQRLSHAYLFEGTAGSGKRALAVWLAMRLFCTNLTPEQQPCGVCQACIRIKEGNHPDVLTVAPDEQTIKVDQIRDLRQEFSKSGVEGTRKIFIIEDAEKMTVGAANSLLKFLEEPVGEPLAILLTAHKQRLLPTIISRCQLLEFRPPAKMIIKEQLEEKGITSGQASILTNLTRDLTKALELSEKEWFNEATRLVFEWFQLLLQKDNQAFVFVQKALLEQAKEKSQQRVILELLLLAYHDLLILSYQKNELTFSAHLDQLEKDKLRTSTTQIIYALEKIFTAQKKAEANVNFQNICEQLVIQLL